VSCCFGLVRLSQCCTLLRSGARDAALWRPILLAFFGGTLPTWNKQGNSEGSALLCIQEDIQGADPLEVLRKQVLFSRALDAQEREFRMLVLPRSCGWQAFYDKEKPISDFRMWDHALNEEDGTRSAAEGLYVRGGSSSRKELHAHACGEFVRLVCVHTSALEAGATSTQASFTQWVRHECLEPAKLVAGDLLDQRGPRRFDGDYGLLAEFKDEKLATLASCAEDSAFASSQRSRVAQVHKGVHIGETTLRRDYT
jgi:hypothetical protein